MTLLRPGTFLRAILDAIRVDMSLSVTSLSSTPFDLTFSLLSVLLHRQGRGEFHHSQ